MTTIPYAQIDTVLLDVGNTLISIDFDWVAGELGLLGQSIDADVLRRAEAAARPGYSHRLFVEGMPADADLFRAYLVAMLERCPDIARLSSDESDELVSTLRQVLRPDGRASVLWRSVMPRVPEALAALRTLGVTLVVVSNSDGTVERSLEAAGLRGLFDHVVDSALAGYEKPDPRIFRHALALAGADPARTLHVGDLYHADVAGARQAGIHSLLLDPYDDWPALDCDSARDVLEVADRLAAARVQARESR
jgi:HAD superfamily hydrolase (TIGR01509 family)